ncbi:MAG: xanthine dehydrogenase accessory protein XdhC [Meiothermus sp.]|uniref:xanthine dehydrogenase accessory protein XdhC n=1 Tax=Meiothermus sp. TaxID=1955249 RepID=UPI0025DF121C|nr:xanthine dehydrogenase accessory protein XdhC [Meiothermus sp.]MCS7068171.1 xanthine dehydrogenase accessory protein XdhC [Meiothermus sp.]
MQWFEHLSRLTEQKVPLVLVTLLSVRGHAPREAGAKMLVTAEASYGTIGGGNLEATATALARRMLAEGGSLELHTLRLTEKAPAEHGVQCCGGEVEVLLEVVNPLRPTVALFGVGHVGWALAKVLSILPIELWLVDSRAEMVAEERMKPLYQNQARIRVFQAPILDGVVGDLPSGGHLVVMTHDHAEDLFVLEAALRRGDLGFIGLIGSAVKWRNFQQKLLQQGFSQADLARVTCPIGLPLTQSKAPEAIAIATAAQLLPLLVGPKTQRPEREQRR